MARQRDSKLVVVGNIATSGSRGYGSDLPVTWVIQRFLTDGRLDPAFGTDGVAKLKMDPLTFASAIVVQPSDQKILIGGESDPSGAGGVEFARLNPDGSLDTSFGDAGTMFLSRPEVRIHETGTMALDATGNTYLAGSGVDRDARHYGVVASVTSTGTANGWAPGGILIPDTSAAGFHAELESVAVSGATVFYGGAAGEYAPPGPALLGAVARSDGAPVAGFGSDGLFRPAVAVRLTGLLLGADGKLKATGSGRGSGPYLGTLIASFKTSGSDPTDRSFGQGGRVVVGGAELDSPTGGSAITEQTGRLFVASNARVADESQGSAGRPALVGVDAATGALDTRLGPQGFRLYDFGGSDAFAGAIAVTDRFVALAGSGDPPPDDYHTAEGLLAVIEAKAAPRAGAVRVRQSQRRLRGGRTRVRVAGRLLVPSGVSNKRGCRGPVAARFLRSGGVVLRRRTRVSSRCRYSLTVTFARQRVPRRVAVRFLGNGAVGASPVRSKKLGRRHATRSRVARATAPGRP